MTYHLDESSNLEVESEVFGAEVYPQQSGLFVFDINRLLMSSEIESYCIEPTIGGFANYLNYSEYN